MARTLGGDRWLVLATGLAAALPVFSSIVRAISEGWIPEGDQAIIAARAHDVLTSHSPLLGPWSTASNIVGEPTFSLGPLLYWLLAVPSRLPGVLMLPVTMGIINTASVVGIVALARRRGGRPLMFASAVALTVMCASLQTEVFHDIWAPTAPLVPITLLIFVCWSIACGDAWLLPLAVLIASFAAQCHLMFLLPAVALLVVGVIGLAWTVRRRPEGHVSRRLLLATLLVAAVCWSAPVADQLLDLAGFERGYGNLSNVAESARAREAPVGLSGGLHAVVRAVGIPPSWLRGPQSEVTRAFELGPQPPALGTVSALAIILGLTGAFAAGIRRGLYDVAAACAIALALLAALCVATASYPNTSGYIFIYGYTARWASPAGMWAWVALGWSALRLWLPRGSWADVRSPALVALSLGVVVATGAVVAVRQREDTQHYLYRPLRTVVDRLDVAIESPASVRVDGNNLTIGSAIVAALHRRQHDVAVDFWIQFGPAYLPERRRYDYVVDIRETGMPRPGGRVIGQVPGPPPAGGPHTVSLLGGGR